MEAIKVCNRIEIGGNIRKMEELSGQEREELGRQLNRNALSAIGYELVPEDSKKADNGSRTRFSSLGS